MSKLTNLEHKQINYSQTLSLCCLVVTKITWKQEPNNAATYNTKINKQKKI